MEKSGKSGMTREFHDTVTAVALSAVTSTPCTAAVREWEYMYIYWVKDMS